jgi:uncharacterized iron-regulated membrane protein
MADAVIVFVVMLFVFGLSFGITHSFPAAIGLTTALVLSISGLVAWIRRHPVKWRARTRASVALVTSLYFAGMGLLSLVVDQKAWPSGILCLVSAVLFAITAASLRDPGMMQRK